MCEINPFSSQSPQPQERCNSNRKYHPDTLGFLILAPVFLAYTQNDNLTPQSTEHLIYSGAQYQDKRIKMFSDLEPEGWEWNSGPTSSASSVSAHWEKPGDMGSAGSILPPR